MMLDNADQRPGRGLIASLTHGEAPRVGPRRKRIVALGVKVIVTGLCFGYLALNIQPDKLLAAARTLDPRWACLATLVVMLQIPLVGVRWGRIVETLGHASERIRRVPLVAITAITAFFAQIVPTVAADTVRVWMLTRLGCGWREGVVSVMLDRAVGIGCLVGVSFAILLFPSAFSTLGGYRTMALEIFGAVLAAATACLLVASHLASVLERWRYTAWGGKLLRAARYLLLGSPAGLSVIGISVGLHLMTILTVWLLGKALGFPLSVFDAAVLFTVMMGAALVPISIGGWGVREVAVTSLLASHGIAPERALLFSLCFGLVLLIATLPGALVWAIYSPNQPRHT